MRSPAQAHRHLQRQLAGLVEELGPTLVTYEIEPAGDTVRLTLSQSHDRPISDDILSGGRGLAGDPVQPEEPAGDRHRVTIQMQPPQGCWRR